MLTLAYYILKITICSGILYGYYLIALRDKIFHKWNRFYLLAAIVISLAAPLIKINVWQNTDEPKTQVVQLLQVVNTGDEFVNEYTRDNGNFQINASNLSLFIYIIVSVFLFAFLVNTLLKIHRLKKKCQQTIVEGINFITTNAKGSPFSFFNNIFWNENIDIGTSTGKQIFKHEVAHVQERHSYDKIFINVLLIFFWINPFFWIIRKELNMIHEFIADKKALEDSDTEAFAAMILQATYPNQQFNLANNFFYSPIKRRLLMLTKNKNPKINYLSRMLVLPFAAMVFFAFTLKMKTINSADNYNGKKITVVIDAGHGGDDKGISSNNIYEKDLALSIAKEIKDLNKNDKINIILSREDDKTISVKDRTLFSNANNADLFVSIHIDGEENKNSNSGLSILIPKNDNAYLKESKLFGTDILESFRTNYQLQISSDLKQPDKGVWILNANQCPAVLIEAGFLTTQKDLEYLSKTKTQKIIAQNILDGIEKYAAQAITLQTNNKISVSDTVPKLKDFVVKADRKDSALIIVDGVEFGRDTKNLTSISPNSIQSISVLKGEAAIKKYGEKGRNGVIEIIKKNENINTTIIRKDTPIIKTDPLYIVDGKEISKPEIANISPNNIQSINVLKGESAVKKYGEKGKNGVVEIITKPSISMIQTDNDKIFTKVEIEPSFPGGQEAWIRYIQKVIGNNVDMLIKENSNGTCVVQFIVDTDGSVIDVKAITMANTKLAEVAINAIKKGPAWNPALQNGHIVTSYKRQPISFKIDDKIVTKSEPE
jgi:N-acetylmuramoyl-L-alanine amidase